MGELLARKRNDYGYASFRQMAEEMGVDESTLDNVVRGDNLPGVKMMRAIVKGLDVSPEVLEEVMRQ